MKYAIRAVAAFGAAAVLVLASPGTDPTATAGGWCKSQAVNGTCPIDEPPPSR